LVSDQEEHADRRAGRLDPPHQRRPVEGGPAQRDDDQVGAIWARDGAERARRVGDRPHHDDGGGVPQERQQRIAHDSPILDEEHPYRPAAVHLAP
jgi:hypothetical protein